MSDKKEHLHSWVLREIADGAPMEEFELADVKTPDFWIDGKNAAHWIWNPSDWRVRRKQKMHRIGEHVFPAPMTEAPEIGSYYWYPSFGGAVSTRWEGPEIDGSALEFGACHLTREAAEAHSKALAAIARGEPI